MDGSLTFEGLYSALDKIQFKKLSEKVPHFGYDSSEFWFRTEIHSRSKATHKWFLEIGYPLLDHVEVFIVSKEIGLVRHFKSGGSVPYENRPIAHRNILFPLVLDPNQDYSLFLKVRSQGSLQVPLKIWKPEILRSRDQGNLIFLGAFGGILLFLIFYNLFLYTFTRNVSYLYYVGIVASLLCFQFSFSGIGAAFAWPSFPSLNGFIVPLSIFSLSATACAFTRAYLHLDVWTPSTDNFYKHLIKIALIGSICVFLASNNAVNKVASLLGGLCSASFIFVGVKSIRANRVGAWWYLTGALSLASGTLILGLSMLGTIPHSIWTQRGIGLAILALVVILKFALSHWVRQIQEDKDKIQEERLKQFEWRSRWYEKHAEEIERNKILAVEDPQSQSATNDDARAKILTLQRCLFNQDHDHQCEQIAHEKLISLGRLMLPVMKDFGHPLEQIGAAAESIEEESRALDELLRQFENHGESLHLSHGLQHLRSQVEKVDSNLQKINSTIDSYKSYIATNPDSHEPIDLNALLQNAISVVHARLKPFKVVLTTEKVPLIHGNPANLTFTVIAILENAIDALDSVRSQHKDRRAFFDGVIRLSAEIHVENPNHVSIAIEDNGGGIGEDKLESCTMAYSTTEREGHSGQGLAISQAVMADHGGTINLAQSLKLGGTKVVLTLPID